MRVVLRVPTSVAFVIDPFASAVRLPALAMGQRLKTKVILEVPRSLERPEMKGVTCKKVEREP